ncbi:MAG TPA: short-chain dehydrogenase [Deltaproteobacteria bacterium]|jgi:NAD(P)-dependent dehydrogenase (short-subunit alcohol dehydrogenase family)|nr:short-chain dehydrogenase [Deltaproteobacteria bacterium]
MSESVHWSAADLPDLAGKVFVVTGGNSGLGLETARELARKGGHVVIACRDAAKAAAALSQIRASAPAASCEALELDLASLASVRAFAEAFGGRYRRLDALCNNAGVMALPYRRTKDGFEMQFGTNHLGHFALTGRLLDVLCATPGARVVNVSSTMHRMGRIRFDDLQSERSYGRWRAYGQSKLANLLFTYELARRAEKAGLGLVSAAAHPGYAATNLQTAGPRMKGSAWMERLWLLGNRLFAQTPAMGALPILYAAAAPGVRGGDYFGPSRVGEMWGSPKKVRSSSRSYDLEAAVHLWQVSQDLTGVDFARLGEEARLSC